MAVAGGKVGIHMVSTELMKERNLDCDLASSQEQAFVPDGGLPRKMEPTGQESPVR